ncbi:MAG: hypothetical protein LBU99_04455 [Spirochaetaceae bacterium]|jgi:hypothetical protein|nr:hypothetical protein [Spirochaetaceae bacterium]
MASTILIAGKDVPQGSLYAAAAAASGRNVVITAPPLTGESRPLQGGTAERKQIVKPPAREFPWNRPSPIASRALVLEAENNFGTIDEALLIFDSDEYAMRYTETDTASFTRAADQLILGYSYLAGELVRRFSAQKSGTLTFLLKTGTVVQGIPAAAARQFFVGLAEGFAAEAQAETTYRVALVRGESSGDDEICTWLYPFLDSLPEKVMPRWYKAGAKTGGVLSLFR